MPEINIGVSSPLLYVKPTIPKQPGQGHSVLSLQSNTDFPFKGKFSISKDLIVWSFTNNSRCLNFRTEYIPQHKIVCLSVIGTNFQSLDIAICFIFGYNVCSVFYNIPYLLELYLGIFKMDSLLLTHYND